MPEVKIAVTQISYQANTVEVAAVNETIQMFCCLQVTMRNK